MFWIARAVTRESLAEANRAAWAGRREIENWADPYGGTDAPALLIGLLAGFIVLLIGILLVRFRRSTLSTGSERTTSGHAKAPISSGP